MEGIDTVVLARIYALVAEAEIVKIEVEGMKAANSIKESYGESLSYTEADFVEKANEVRSIFDELNAYGGG